MNKHRRMRILWFFFVILIASYVVFIGGGKKKEPSVGKVEEKRACRLWFWGEDEAPGLTDFLKWVGEEYTKRVDPKVTWEVTHLDIDQIYTGFYAAVEAKDAPEIHTLWGGVLGLEPAWAGLLAPISDYVSEETLSKIHPVNRHDGYWNGKDWLIPLYLNPWPLVINKQVWRKSGLDPDNLPTTWKGFMAAIRKIRAAGFTPWCVGIKDGFYGTWFPAILQFQLYNSPADYHRAIIGEERLDQPPHSNRWYQVQELRDNGAFNPDANSLSLAEGQDLFLKGDVAIIHASGNAYIALLFKTLGEENLKLWIPPLDSTAYNAGKIPISTQPVAIPKVAKYKEDAGKFLEFFYTREIQNEMYRRIHVFSGSTELDRNLMTTSMEKAIYDMAMNTPGMCYVWQHPGALEEESYAITQKLLAGDINAAEAAKQWEQTAVKWRKENPEMVKNFRIWATEKMPFMK
jgi:ABC-type glycerol-3-phosphate transport system substrate-binding protein